MHVCVCVCVCVCVVTTCVFKHACEFDFTYDLIDCAFDLVLLITDTLLQYTIDNLPHKRSISSVVGR